MLWLRQHLTTLLPPTPSYRSTITMTDVATDIAVTSFFQLALYFGKRIVNGSPKGLKKRADKKYSCALDLYCPIQGKVDADTKRRFDQSKQR
jgi:hypothetical protein